MNLFRSEEHARNSATFTADFAHMLMPLAEWADIFSSPMFRERGRPDYISWLRSPEGQAATAAMRAKMPPAALS
jgi:hypothetical protein